MQLNQIFFFLLLSAFFFLAFVQGDNNQTGWSPGTSPAFCHGDDCPVFNVTYNATAYNASLLIEIRDYAPGIWTSVNATGTEFSPAANPAFFKLYKYISGQNENNEDIPMTAPVAIEVIPGSGPFCNSTFIESFFAPFAYQLPSNPLPTPMNPELYIHSQPARRLAVIQFGGFVRTFNDIIPSYLALSQWLNEQGYEYDQNAYTVCEYNNPYQIQNRHNEVWIELPIDS